MRLLIATLFLALTLPAGAHDHGFGSWIGRESIRDPVTNEWCCNAGDCKELVGTDAFDPATQERGSVTQLQNGKYLVSIRGEKPLTEEIDAKRVIWRSPGSWWRCHRPDKTKSTRCLIGPPPGS